MKYIKIVVYYLNYGNNNILQKHINEFESLKTGIFCVFAKKQKIYMFSLRKQSWTTVIILFLLHILND